MVHVQGVKSSRVSANMPKQVGSKGQEIFVLIFYIYFFFVGNRSKVLICN